MTGQQRAWIRWLHLGKYYYNTTHHMSIGMTPFHALYGYDALSFAHIVFGDSRAPKAKDWIVESQDILKVLKDNLVTSQDQQKMYADRHRTERHFEEGDLVYLQLQPYRQLTLKQKGAEKLQPRFNGPYRLVRRVGEVAYKLELPQGSRIHNIFHVSCLKKVLGQQVTTTVELPPLDDEGHLVLEPEAILETSKTIKEFLVRWKNLPDEDATWEGEHILVHLALELLEGKQ